MATYYIAPIGSDSNAGTQALPFLTLQHAANVAVAGDTVITTPGTYTITSQVTFATSGTALAPITFVSQPTWAAHIVAVGIPVGLSIEGDYVSIAGFDLTGDSNFLNGIIARKTFASVRYNRVHDYNPACNVNGGMGVGSSVFNGIYSGSHNDFIGNIIFNVGPLGGACNAIHGVYCALPFDRAINNISINNAGRGIQFFHAATNNIIANNLCAANRVGAGLIVDNSNIGGNDNTFVVNNICYSNNGPGILENAGAGTHNRYLNNCCFANSSSSQILLTNGTQSGTVLSNPQFVNYQANATGDYHLLRGSPCINTGTATDAPTNDAAQGLRSLKSAMDIGPYLSLSTAIFPSTNRRIGQFPMTTRRSS